MSFYADLSGLPPIAEQHADPDRLFGELQHVIIGAIAGHPRSQQTRIGPSEIGTPCTRRLAHKLAGTPEVNERGPAWRPTVGTAVHEWLADKFIQDNARHDPARWLVEFKVNAGMVGDQVLDGSCDLYCRVTDTVVDWKVVGATALKKYRKDGPGEQYRIQAHTYALGWERRGMPVRRVALVFLPSAGELTDAVFWHEPYAPDVATAAIDRATLVARLVGQGGSHAAAALPTADAWCSYCPWHLPAATDLTEACPGHREPAAALNAVA